MMLKKRNRNILYDPFIIARVKQYLEENTHQTYVDVTQMARALQDKYRDYNRRKVAPFRQLVEHAYQIVLHSYGLGSNDNSELEDYNSDDQSIELLDEESENDVPAPNLLGDVMNSLYTKKSAPALVGGTTQAAGPQSTSSTNNNQTVTTTTAAAAPIDISSDEDEEDKEPTTAPPAKEAAAGSNATNVHPNNQPLASIPAFQHHIPNGSGGLPPKMVEKRPNHHQERETAQRVNKKRKIAPVPAPSLALLRPAVTNKKPGAPKKEIIKTSKLTFNDVGGLDKILKELCELLLHLKHPELYEHIGLTAPRGFLLHGPPGSGKTLLANAIAGQLKVPLIDVAATELVAGISGESEERIREVFEKAASVAPCVLFIDEVDVISANRNHAQKDLERRIVSQLLTSLDGLAQLPNGNKVVVIGATNRADSLDPALRRVGRFDQEICLGIPDRVAREQILKIVCRTLLIEEPFSFDDLAVLTPGYVGADLLALAMRAATMAVKRAFGLKDFHKKSTVDEEVDVEAQYGNIADLPGLINAEEEQQMDVEHGDGDQVVKEGSVVTLEDPPATTGSEISTATETMEVEKHETKDDEPGQSNPPMKKKEGEACATVQRQHTLDEMIEWLNGENETPLTKDEIDSIRVTMGDFKSALSVVQPSAKREGFITVPDVTWDDIGSLGDIRDELKLAILAPVKYPKKLEQLGLQSPSGVLLCGPPGCGKTLLAKAVANEAGINFISVKGPELLNMYVGESERAVRQCFQRAKNSAPCVIFFDEFDALCPKRSSRSEQNGAARVVNQLLTEMDGVEDRRGVFLMAATNRPDMIDGAVLRPGRLDKILYVGLPEVDDREDILRALTKGGTKPPLAEDVCFKSLAGLAAGFTGADLGGLVREASLQALKESLLLSESAPQADNAEEKLFVNKDHFIKALNNIKPSVTEEDKRNYERLQKLYGSRGTE